MNVPRKATTLRIGAARAAAKDWVVQEGRRFKGYRGAYFNGSTVGLPQDSELPVGSDVDINLVIEQRVEALKPGKFEHNGALLEVTLLSWDQISPAETSLASYHIAGGLRRDTIIDDPSGDLRRLQRDVARDFADEAWVRLRLESVLQRIHHGLQAIDASAPWHDQVTAWLFPTGITAHLLLVAALHNPTVRLRYLKARQVLAEYGRLDRYPDLLRFCGCHDLTPQRVERHVHSLAHTFDAAAAAARTPFLFSSDMTPAARPIAIDASRELIDQGDHREAMFWIVATFARCQKILAADTPAAVQREFTPAFDAVLADLGIASTHDLLARARSTIAFLPNLWKTTEEILAANPDVTRTGS